jgi:hypothetical protein
MVAWLDHRIDIPAWIATAIGRIAAEWSDLEYQIEDVIRIMLRTDIASARVAASGMNIRSRVQVAAQLIRLHKVGDTLLDEMTSIAAETTERVEPLRNMVIHAIWARIEGQWYVQYTKGARKDGNRQKLPRAILPQRKLITRDVLRSIRDDISALRARVDALRSSLEAALPPSPHISPRQHRQRLPTRARRRKAL